MPNQVLQLTSKPLHGFVAAELQLFTYRAATDLQRLRAFIDKGNPLAARRKIDALRRSIRSLSDQPRNAADGPAQLRPQGGSERPAGGVASAWRRTATPARTRLADKPLRASESSPYLLSGE